MGELWELRGDGKHSLGRFLLDAQDNSNVLYETGEHIVSPRREYTRTAHIEKRFAQTFKKGYLRGGFYDLQLRHLEHGSGQETNQFLTALEDFIKCDPDTPLSAV